MRVFYSTDDEDYSLTDLSEVYLNLENEDRLHAGTIYYESDGVPVQVSDIFSIDQMMETVKENLYGIVGESYDRFKFSENDLKQLSQFITNWMYTKTNIGEYYRLTGKIRQVVLTQEDVDSYNGK